MMLAIVFAAVLAVASAQFPSSTARPFRYQTGGFLASPQPPRFPLPSPQPTRYPLPSPQPTRYPLPSPQPTRFPLVSPQPTRFPLPSPVPPRPSAVPVLNRQTNDQAAEILRYESDSSPDGSFVYAFDTTNGISVEAQGTPRDFGGNPPVAPDVIQGRYSHTAPDGSVIEITYIADENGFQPQGAAIPTPPPIPEAILRSLEFIARNPQVQQK